MSRGHIRQRAKGSWTLTVELPADPTTGKRQHMYETVRGTKRDALRRLSDLQTEVDAAGFVKPSRMTLGEFLEQWLRDYAKMKVRPRTLEGYQGIVRAHLIPKLGSIPLSELQPAHLQHYYSDALENGRLDGKEGGLSARSVLHHHRVLSKALLHAVKWKLTAQNVAKAVDPPSPRRTEIALLDTAAIGRLLEAAQGTVYFPMIHLALYTGLRRSEFLGLRWADVNLDMATLSVVRVMHKLRDGRIIFQEPKTAKGRRLVALSPTAVLALRAHREHQEADRAAVGDPLADDALVFSHLDGSPFLPDSVSHAFTKIVRRAGLKKVRLHDLRHAHASLMLRQGIHPKIVQERLGHSTIAITLDTYSHVTPGLQEAAALKFDEELAETVPVNGSVDKTQTVPLTNR
ncbi:MAG: site-specific integrase [Chloroflexi bacterium]|nr:site-specific integrase [Chloroflexota bacterium]